MVKSVRRKWFKVYTYGWLQGRGRVGDYVVSVRLTQDYQLLTRNNE